MNDGARRRRVTPIGGATLVLLAGAGVAPCFPEDRHDPTPAALRLARELDPALDDVAARRALDAAATALRAEVAQAATPQARLAALTRAVHERLGLDADDGAAALDLDGLLPDRVLRRRRGGCLGLSLVYLTLGARAGLDVRGVALPGHFFVRLHDGGRAWNLETTVGGQERDDAWYRERFRLPDPAPGNYLRDLTPAEVDAEVLNNAGGALLRAGDARRALDLLRRACAAAPDDPDAHYNLALARREVGDAAGALERVERALALWPRSREALNLRGLLRLADRPDLAAADFAAAIELEPGEARYWNNRGAARWRLGELGPARADLTRALELRPGWPEARRNLLLVRVEAQDPAGDLAPDVAALEPGDWPRLLRSLPPHPTTTRRLAALAADLAAVAPGAAAAAHLEAASRLLAQRDPQGARRACDAALSLRGADAVLAYCLRGEACDALGDEVWAKRSFILAMERDPRDPRGWRHMGHHYLRRDRFASAAEWFRGYLERAPDDAPDRAEIEAIVRKIGEALR